MVSTREPGSRQRRVLVTTGRFVLFADIVFITALVSDSQSFCESVKEERMFNFWAGNRFAASLSSVAVVNQHFRWLNGPWLTWDLCWTIGDAKSSISWGENIQLLRSSDSVPGEANHVFLTILQDWNKPSRQCLALGNDVQSPLHFLAAHELEVCLVFVPASLRVMHRIKDKKPRNCHVVLSPLLMQLFSRSIRSSFLKLYTSVNSISSHFLVHFSFLCITG